MSGRCARAQTFVLALVLCACQAGSERPETTEPPSGDGGLVIDLDAALDAGPLPYDCAIGVAESLGDPGFRALEPGGAIPIGGRGQAGLTARMALRCTPASDDAEPLSEADVELVLTNAFTGVVAPREPGPVPRRLACSERTCDLAPLEVEISHLAKLPELEGLVVRADLRVLSATGELLGLARTHGVFTPS